MATLRDIKDRISAVKGTAKITSAMKMVAAAKMKRAQGAIESARPYVSKLDHLMSNLVASLDDDYANALVETREHVGSIAIIVIGSDRGLCGGFNTNLYKSLNTVIKTDLKIKYPDATFQIVSVGKKPSDFYQKSMFEVQADFPGVFANLQFSVAREIVNSVKDDFVDGKFDKVYLFYNSFVNIVRQKATLDELLPISPAAKDSENQYSTDYIYEPDMESILDVLIPKLVDIKVWRSMLESNAAEQAARMMAMDNATNNARDLIRSLSLTYNSLRQEAITTEMLEIVGGAEALKG